MFSQPRFFREEVIFLISIFTCWLGFAQLQLTFHHPCIHATKTFLTKIIDANLIIKCNKNISVLLLLDIHESSWHNWLNPLKPYLWGTGLMIFCLSSAIPSKCLLWAPLKYQNFPRIWSCTYFISLYTFSLGDTPGLSLYLLLHDLLFWDQTSYKL